MFAFALMFGTLLTGADQTHFRSSGSLAAGTKRETSKIKGEGLMTIAEAAQLTEALATKLAILSDRENGKVVLYAEAGPAWMGGAIFVGRADAVDWHSPADTGVSDLVMELWAVAAPDKKWRGMTMIVSGDKFRVEFDYGENWSPDEDESDRRESIVRAHFGDKPIDYPPLEGAEHWPGS